MTRPRFIRTTALAILTGLFLALVVGPASCKSDDDSDSGSTKKDEVKAAYLAYWKMGARLLEAPDPTDPEIPQRTTTGKARSAQSTSRRSTSRASRPTSRLCSARS